MLTGLRFCYYPSTVSFSASDGPVCGLESHDKIYWQEDDLRMSFWCKGVIDSIAIGLGTWCGRPKSQQRGGKLMAHS